MKLVNIAHNTKGKPLKRSKTGMEVELHLLDSKGKISFNSPQIISKVKKIYPDLPILKECGKSMVELGCYPGVETFSPALDLVESLEVVYDVARKNDLYLHPFGTYPGKYTPELSKGDTYKMKQKLFGIDRFDKATKCTGFHHHYSLPKGVFDAKSKTLKLLMQSKLKRSMINCYNLEIAIDPILTLFTQSSPFFDGRHLAKDSRMVVYRGGRKLNYPTGVYTNLQQFGGLPPYKQTGTDLLSSMNRRQIRWRTLIKKSHPNVNFRHLYPYLLDIGWNPVKINKHGTIEQRGMDMNYLSTLFAVTILIRSCLKKIQEEYIELIPADFAITEAFKEENGIMFIPPHTHVRNELQYYSAYDGYKNEGLYNYAKRFFSFAKSITPKKYGKIIKPIADMIDKKESTSDMVLKYAKRKGYVDDNKINTHDAAELSLHFADKFYKDLETVKGSLEAIKSL